MDTQEGVKVPPQVFATGTKSFVSGFGVVMDISTEMVRTYTFPGGDKVTIRWPLKLHVSASRGHRIVDAAGKGHYIPFGWIHIEWEVKPGAPVISF
jgi:hypothetical protein